MNKKRAILITGFSNWGKSTIIRGLFNIKRFSPKEYYEINGINSKFIVMPYSNDDISKTHYLNKLEEKYEDVNPAKEDLLSAFCPSSEEKTNSREILESDFFSNFDEIILIYLVDRWDNHALLNMENIKSFYKGLENLKHIEIIIDQSNKVNERLNAKIIKIKEELTKIYK